MIKLSRWYFRPIIGQLMMGLVFTAIFSSINVAPSCADNGYYPRGRGDRYDHDRYRHGRWHDRGRYRYYDDGYRELIFVDTGYRERVYVSPPPVYYSPPPPVYYAPPPGISISLPPIVIR
jgi:hypothetical protein